jgi:hypothetical protein
MKPPKDASKENSPPNPSKKSEDELNDELRLWLRWDEHVPQGHVALPGTFWRVKEGDIVWYVQVVSELYIV